MSSRVRNCIRILLWVAGLALAIWHYCDEGLRVMVPANRELDSYDQVFYLNRASEIATLGHQRKIQRSRMPLYPWILSHFHQEGQTREELFEHFKWINAGLSIVALLGVLVTARWALGTALGVPLTAAAAYTFIVFKAPLVQPEVLFYALYFVTFVLMWRCLKSPDWRWAVAAGAAAGVTHLTKGSLLPMLTAFLVVSAFSDFIALARGRRQGTMMTEAGSRHRRRASKFQVPAATAATFLVITGPLLWNSVRTFGNPFYDPNTVVYFWASSPNEMAALQKFDLAQQKPVLDARIESDPLVREFLPQWADSPDQLERLEARVQAGETVPLEGEFDILPSARKWFARHSVAEAVGRIGTGLVQVIGRNFIHRNGYGRHLALWLGLAVISLAAAVVVVPARCAEEAWTSRFAFAFALLNIAGNLLLYGWWGQVSNRNRFFLTQFLPVLFVCGVIIRFCAQALPWELSLPRVSRLAGRHVMVTPWGIVIVVLWILTLMDVEDLDPSVKQLPQ